MLHVYSLADYQLTIGIPETVAKALKLKDEYGNYLTSYQIGGPGENGEGSFVGSIAVSRDEAAWSTEGDKTGSWVHNRSLRKTGKITLNLNQISEQGIDLYHLCQIYESIEGSYEGLTLTINTNGEDTTPLAKGVDAYISKQPDYPMGEAAADLTWEFTCGQILYFTA